MMSDFGDRDVIRLILDQDARIAELKSTMKELIAATNEFVGWHRTDKIVVRDVERIEDWRRAREAAHAALNDER